MLKYNNIYFERGKSMASENSILSKEPEFYSAYEYEEEYENEKENIFGKVLFQLLVLVSIFLTIYFSYKYLSNMDIDFKKFNFWSVAKQNNPPTLEIHNEVTSTESSLKVKESSLKKIDVEPIVKEVIKNLHKEKVVEVSKINLAPIVKQTEITTQKEVKKPYLVDEYLEAIKKELGNN